VFAPHPDDETLGCGGTIAKKIAEGYDVLVVIMTDGRYAFLKTMGLTSDPTPEEVKEIREEEAKKAVRILGVPEENLIFLNFVDGTLQNNMEEAEKKITEILEEKHPVEVYFPHKNDYHPDHQTAYQIVKNSITKLGISAKMYQYLTTYKYDRLGPLLNRLLNYFRNNVVYVDISKFLKKKEASVKEFKSEITNFLDKQQKPVVRDIERFLKPKEVFYIDK